ncbi:hypothetical protein Pyn_11351 [Prunus yedoensis var. nudiflora]|uniref:Uncharacterized protein n=1 Tax=Prunus yedoensis var. nudiflora TaxID=2094558 RepID=A0A314YPQ8_PRUYE|nr:hypothetical protein Pyn_11351 [Prunus yedoensis var. nudiflora]
MGTKQVRTHHLHLLSTFMLRKPHLQAHLGDRGLAKELQPGAALREAVVEIFRDVVEEGAGGWGGD